MDIKTSITINAKPEKVWEVLTNFSEYSNWNPFIRSIEGDVKVGEKVKVNFEKMTFKPKILKFTKNKELQWIGRLIMPGIFDGKHRFLLIDNQDGTTKVEHSEHFGGVLVPFLKKKLKTETKSDFEKMNLALKAIVEKDLQK